MDLQDELRVNYCHLAVVSTDPPEITDAFRIGLGAVCLLAGLEKARAPRDFFEGVRQYALIPARLAPAAGGALIGAELAIGLLLVSGLVPALAAAGAIALFAVFAAALAVSLARSNTAPCHCFGAS